MSGPDTRLFGAVLAGGASRRFGADKARAEVGGRAMAARALDALDPWVDAVGVVVAADAPGGGRGRRDGSGEEDDGAPGGPGGAGTKGAPAWGRPVRRDSSPGLGPLEGLRVALEWAREEGYDGVVVLACDLPLVDASAVGALVRAWRRRGPDAADGIVPVVEGRPQPLAAVYSTAILGTVTRRLAGEARSVTGMLRDLRVGRLPTGSRELPVERFLNVNTPDDAGRARAILEGGGEAEVTRGEAEASPARDARGRDARRRDARRRDAGRRDARRDEPVDAGR